MTDSWARKIPGILVHSACKQLQKLLKDLGSPYLNFDHFIGHVSRDGHINSFHFGKQSVDSQIRFVMHVPKLAAMGQRLSDLAHLFS
jgi:hypothetical protein